MSSHGFVYHADGSFTILDAPGAINTPRNGTAASDINANGVITGITISGQISHSFVRAPDGSFTFFDPPGAGPLGSGVGFINSSGAAIGYFSDTKSVQHGFLRNADGSIIIIDDPYATTAPNLNATVVTGLNDSGVIVGNFTDINGAQHGFVRK